MSASVVRKFEETSSGEMRCLIEVHHPKAFIGFRFAGYNVPEFIAAKVRELWSLTQKDSK